MLRRFTIPILRVLMLMFLIFWKETAHDVLDLDSKMVTLKEMSLWSEIGRSVEVLF